MLVSVLGNKALEDFGGVGLSGFWGGLPISNREAGERHRTEGTEETEDTEGVEAALTGEAMRQGPAQTELRPNTSSGKVNWKTTPRGALAVAHKCSR
jgi:hypothetical protein